MSPSLARVLTSLYPRYWRERYGEEFEAFLQSGPSDLRTFANVVWSALWERISPTPELQRSEISRSFPFPSWLVRAPWAMFGLVPLFLLAGAYFVACLILWSGWRFFLPETDTPFVRIDGFAIFYFGVGRLLYYGAPILIGWGIGFVAAQQRFKAFWPGIGLILMAFLGSMAQVHASRPGSGGAGRISMGLALGPSERGVPDFLFHSLLILAPTVLPYLLWRLQKTHSLSA